MGHGELGYDVPPSNEAESDYCFASSLIYGRRKHIAKNAKGEEYYCLSKKDWFFFGYYMALDRLQRGIELEDISKNILNGNYSGVVRLIPEAEIETLKEKEGDKGG